MVRLLSFVSIFALSRILDGETLGHNVSFPFSRIFEYSKSDLFVYFLLCTEGLGSFVVVLIGLL